MVVLFDGSVVMRRIRTTLMSVSRTEEIYEVTVTAPDGAAVTVTPTQLTFSNYMEHNKYIVNFIRTEVVKSAGMWESGEIVWKGKKHHARSPMAFGY